MFFSKVKRIASELGPAIQDNLKIPFIGSRYFNASSGSFNPPSGFYDDHYIRGQVFGQIAFLTRFAFPGASLSTQQTGEVLIKVWEHLAGADGHRITREYVQEMRKGDGGGPEFLRGHNDACTLVGAAYGKLKHDDPDAIYQEAVKLAPSLHRTVADVAVIPTVGTSDSAGIPFRGWM